MNTITTQPNTIDLEQSDIKVVSGQIEDIKTVRGQIEDINSVSDPIEKPALELSMSSITSGITSENDGSSVYELVNSELIVSDGFFKNPTIHEYTLNSQTLLNKHLTKVQ